LEVVTSVATALYPFYFVVVPRISSNREEVRFGEVAVLKQILCCHQKKIQINSTFWLREIIFFVAARNLFQDSNFPKSFFSLLEAILGTKMK